MDTGKFTADRQGELIQIANPDDWSFLPDPLPPKWEFSTELWPLLAEAKQALGKLDGIGQTLPHPELLLQPLQQREALRSSSLEGTYATPEELLLFEIEPSTPTSKQDQANAWLEVHNYRVSLREGYNSLHDRPLSLSYIRELHKWLTSDVRGQEKSPGQFRNTQVHIGSGRRFVPAPPTHMQQLLEALEVSIRNPSEDYDPLVYCYLVHYQFETIHPFKDGNGRVGRLFLALTTCLWCKLSMPWLYMSPFFERYKDEYINLLFNVSARGSWTKWIEFCLRGTIEQSSDAIRRCQLLGKLKEDFLSRIEAGSSRVHLIIEDLLSRPMTTVPIVRDSIPVSYPTAKLDVDFLVSIGILKPLEISKRPVFYYAPEIFNIAYADVPFPDGEVE